MTLVTAVVQAPTPVDAAVPDQAFDSGLKAYQRGAFEEAASSWTEAAAGYAGLGRQGEQVGVLTHLARAYSALGQYRRAVAVLEEALPLGQRVGQPARLAEVLAGLGDAHIVLGPLDTADAYVQRALDTAKQVGNPALTASVLNTLGNLRATQERYPEAVAAYREGTALAVQAGQPWLAATQMANGARALRRAGKPQESRDMLNSALDQLRRASGSHDTAYGLINVGVGYRDLRSALPDQHEALSLRAAAALNDAATMASQISDRRAASYASGYLGSLYADERRYPEALRLTRQAIFAAQQANAPESLYRWQWQAGRLLVKQGATANAIEAYRRAVVTLQAVRPELSVGYGVATSFRDSVGPVYTELVDLLLQQASSLQQPDEIGKYLVEARETVELVKAAELRDFFRDECVDTALSKSTKLDVVSQTAVIVYPILLPDRTELLVSLPAGLKRFAVPIGAGVLGQEVRELRRKLEKRTTREYLTHAQQLYDWLIRPFEGELAAAKTDTLVFVPDGPLRTIPMAALHDGKDFLVRKYALGITPGLNLTDPRPIKRKKARVLGVGVTESVQGFPPLPSVSTELRMLQRLYGSTTLIDQDFRVANFEKLLKDEPYTIVHIASHGQFEGEVDKTFLLTFDGKLTMDRLEQLIGVFKFRDDPLELLTLSACDTAAGDERAALGLAGVAIKAGARSALATLWQVNDEASAELVVDFYRELQDPSISRAAALQRAQLKMLADPRYEHPGFWSPFLLINNWL
ncbi:MAG: CHAT domain-containing protein [Candidatus Rokuibacteriota bacterium]